MISIPTHQFIAGIQENFNDFVAKIRSLSKYLASRKCGFLAADHTSTWISRERTFEFLAKWISRRAAFEVWLISAVKRCIFRNEIIKLWDYLFFKNTKNIVEVTPPGSLRLFVLRFRPKVHCRTAPQKETFLKKNAKKVFFFFFFFFFLRPEKTLCVLWTNLCSLNMIAEWSIQHGLFICRIVFLFFCVRGKYRNQDTK